MELLDNVWVSKSWHLKESNFLGESYFRIVLINLYP